MSRLRALTAVLVLLGACSARQAAVSNTAPSPRSWAEGACRVVRPEEYACRIHKTRRPSRGVSRAKLLSTDGRAVFFYGTRDDQTFDAASLRFAMATTWCGLWEDVFAWDTRDVYTLAPASCGGSNCSSPDYHGYWWEPLGVRAPAAFHWLDAGYGADDRFVYHRWHAGRPLDGAAASRFEVIRCGSGDAAVTYGRDGNRWYRGGEVMSDADVRAAIAGSPRL